MFKILFGFVSGLLFAVCTIALSAVGMAVALDSNSRTKKTPARPTPSQP